MKNKMIFKVVFASYMVALAIVFDLVMKAIPIFKMPMGGSVTISLLPLALAAVVCGLWYSLASAIVYGVINCFVLDAYGFNLVSFILDYFVAYLGVAILAIPFFSENIRKGKRIYFILGFMLAYLVRYLASSFSGIFNAKAWGYDSEFLEGIFGPGKGSTGYLYIYSFIIYNLPYMLVSCVVQIVIGLLIYKPIFLGDFINKNTGHKKAQEAEEVSENTNENL